MGLPVMIMGESGSGKSASLRNFEKKDVLVFSVAGKRLPFRKKLNVINLHDMAGIERYEVITAALHKYKDQCKTFVIDDSQYLMSFEELNRWAEKGYEKFAQMALHFSDLLFTIKALPDDIVVYLLHHTDIDDYGRLKVKTTGKMLDSKITIEGLFEIVLLAECVDGTYIFNTHNDGRATTKSPIGMFEDDTIENDLKHVNDVIRNYYMDEEE